jgi:hypothetical protein
VFCSGTGNAVQVCLKGFPGYALGVVLIECCQAAQARLAGMASILLGGRPGCPKAVR